MLQAFQAGKMAMEHPKQEVNEKKENERKKEDGWMDEKKKRMGK